jgi:hypothetical protein
MFVTITRLKELLYKEIGSDFIDEGFSFSKSAFRFQKKINKNRIICNFGFYDYKPDWVEYNFNFYFRIFELEKECQRFNDFCGLPFNGCPILLVEGDLHPDTKDRPRKWRVDFTHKIYDLERDIHEIEEARMILKQEFFPRLPIYSSLESFQTYILNDYYSILHDGNIFTPLIAAKCQSNEELNKMATFLWRHLDLENKDDRHFSKKFVKNIIAYSEKFPLPVEKGYKSPPNVKMPEIKIERKFDVKIETLKDIIIKGYAGDSESNVQKN